MPQQEPIRKNKQRVRIWIIVVVFLIIVGSIFFIFRGKGEEKKLSASIPCTDTDIEFNLISCEYVKSGSFYDSTIKFKRIDNSDLIIQEVFAIVSGEEKLKFKEVSVQNLYDEQEYEVSIYNSIPKSFYLLNVLDEEVSCRTKEISCTEIFVEEQQSAEENSQQENGEAETTGEEESNEKASEQQTSADQIEDAIREALGL